MPWFGAITLGLAILGAVLGILNAWVSLRRDQVRLRVRPLSVIVTHGLPFDFGIEVINLSLFPVTLEEVGFTLDGNSANCGDRAVVFQPHTSDGGPWPRRLEPLPAVTLYFETRYLPRPLSRLGRAYARTACWEFAYGSTPASRSLRLQ